MVVIECACAAVLGLGGHSHNNTIHILAKQGMCVYHVVQSKEECAPIQHTTEELCC